LRSAIWKAMTLVAFSAGTTLVGTAQTSTAAPNQPDVVAKSDPPSAPDVKASASSGAANPAQPQTQLTVEQEIAILKNRIEQLESEVKQSNAAAAESESRSDAAALTGAEKALVSGGGAASLHAADPSIVSAQTAPPAAPAEPAPPEIGAQTTTKGEPFPGDWTWLNSNGHAVDSPMSTKYFTPEFRADANYILDYNHPEDDTMGGATESFRSDEWQLEQISVGGDIRINNVRGRILTMDGLFATTTPRNDASYSRGQWDLSGAYKYVSEAWGGYHWDVAHGLNVDAGIFV